MLWLCLVLYLFLSDTIPTSTGVSFCNTRVLLIDVSSSTNSTLSLKDPDDLDVPIMMFRTDSKSETSENFLSSPALSNANCVDLLVETDSFAFAEEMFNVISSSRLSITLHVHTHDKKAADILEFHQRLKKPTFDASVTLWSNGTKKTTFFAAIDSPSWKTFALNYVLIPPAAYHISENEPTGIDIDLWQIAAKHLMFESRFLAAPYFTTLASRLVNGSDVSVSQPTFTYSRYKVGIDFSTPLDEYSLHIYTRNPRPADKLNALVYPYSRNVWIAILISMATVALFLSLSSILNERIPSYYIIVVSVTAIIVESLPQKYMQLRNTSPSSYIAMFVWIFFGALLTYSYSSTLLASLVAEEYEDPVETFQDLIERNILLTLPKGTYLTLFLKYSANPYARETEAIMAENGGYYFSEGGEVPPEYSEMIDEGIAATISSPNLAVGQEFDRHKSKEGLPPMSSGFYFRLNLPMREKLDKTLGRLLDSGMYDYLKKRHLFIMNREQRELMRSNPDATPEENKERPLEIRHLLPVLIALGIGLCLGLGSFSFEVSRKFLCHGLKVVRKFMAMIYETFANCFYDLCTNLYYHCLQKLRQL